MKPENLRVHAALLAVSLIYGYFYVAVKLILQALTAAELILLRLGLTALIVVLVERLFFRTRFESRGDLLKTLGLGLVGVLFVQIMVVWGLSLTTAFHSALIMSAIPIITAGMSILLGRETYHPQKLLGIMIAFAGVAVLLFFSKSGDTPLPDTYLLGDFITLLNAAGFSWFLIGSQSLLQKYNSFSYMAYCYMISGLLYTLAFVGLDLSRWEGFSLAFAQTISPTHWLLVAYVVLFASIGTYTLNNYALRRANPTTVSIYVFIQPVISAITGYYLLHEPFNLAMGVAALLTFAGVLIAGTAAQKGRYLHQGD